jgi:hypothetical protein
MTRSNSRWYWGQGFRTNNNYNWTVLSGRAGLDSRGLATTALNGRGSVATLSDPIFV